MTLKDIEIVPTYSTDDEINTPADAFYNPALKEAKYYKRVAGYFSSSSFAFIGDGLKRFILNGGHMQFIFNVHLSEEDYINIQIGFDNPERIIKSRFLDDFSNFEDECIYNHARVLGWLIAKEHLDIKIGYIYDSFSPDGEQKTGPLLHQKLGLIEDNIGNIVAFNGSNNESANGWMYNNEYLTAFCSWKKGHAEFIAEIKKNFEDLWNNQAKRTKVISFPEAVKEKLLSIAPRNEIELRSILDALTKKKNQTKADIDTPETPKDTSLAQYGNIKLRDYQIQAVDSWFDNNCTGLFEMATGTGKTITAIAAYRKILDREKNIVLVVLCPYAHLPYQWEKTMRDMDLGVTDYIRADGTVPNWDQQIFTAIYRSYNSRNRRRIVVVFATHDTASTDRFHKLFDDIQNSPAKSTWMLICDEVHSIGTPTYRKALYDEYKYRLGLSATPERYFDPEGTRCIREYFGRTVFEFSLREAMDTINPDTGQPYLVSYDYYIKFVELTNKENEAYAEYSRKIAGLKGIIDLEGGDAEKEKQLETWYNNRAKIVKNAANKLSALKEIISEMYNNNTLSHLLVYCSDSDPKQIDSVAEYLDEFSDKHQDYIKYKKYIQSLSARVSKTSGKSEREKVLYDFSMGHFDVLLAMKCLDEGVDIPSTQSAILMCSSGNSKEYIQRRGRILRPDPEHGKVKAILYDIAVLPPVTPDIEKEIATNEIIIREKRRLEEFAKDSINKPNIDILITKELTKRCRK